VADDLDALLSEQRRYYDQRAGEYDEAYTRTRAHDRGPDGNAEWRREMERLTVAFDAVPLAGDVLELAAGTGTWTARIAGRASSLTVIDASAAMLDANRDRLGALAASVDYRVADLFVWEPEREWDACVFGFFLCKVPDSRVDGWLRVVASAVRAGGAVCCVDKTATVEPDIETEERVLNDGRRFRIIDHPRPPGRVAELFETAGFDVRVETFGPRFCLARGIRA